MDPTPQKANTLPYIIAGLLILSLAGALGYYFWDSFRPKEVELKGLDKAQGFVSQAGNMVINTKIQQSFEGTLKSTDSKNISWTIEKDGKSLTITHNGFSEIKYSLIPKEKGAPSEPINPADIKVGDRVVIYTLIDGQTGDLTVTSVFVRL